MQTSSHIGTQTVESDSLSRKGSNVPVPKEGGTITTVNIRIIEGIDSEMEVIVLVMVTVTPIAENTDIEVMLAETGIFETTLPRAMYIITMHNTHTNPNNTNEQCI